MSDYISRAEAVKVFIDWGMKEFGYHDFNRNERFIDAIKALPSAEAVQLKQTDTLIIADAIDAIQNAYCKPCKERGDDHNEVRCRVCEYDNAIIQIDALPSADAYFTDGNKIAEWIPCSERLPKAEDMYQPPEQRYLCQLEAYGERKFCVLSRLKGAISPFWDWYGVAIHDSEVTAWMPLPKPYKGGDDE